MCVCATTTTAYVTADVINNSDTDLMVALTVNKSTRTCDAALVGLLYVDMFLKAPT